MIHNTYQDFHFRSIAYSQYAGIENRLYVAISKTDEQKQRPVVNVYGSCSEIIQGLRPFIASVVTESSSDGAIGGYGIAFDPEDNLYVSFEDLDAVLRFSKNTFLPMGKNVTSGNNNGGDNDDDDYDNSSAKYYNATFYKASGVKGLAAVKESLWVANPYANKIIILGFESGKELAEVHIDSPNNLYYDVFTNVVYASSRGYDWGKVYAYNASYPFNKLAEFRAGNSIQ